VSRQRGVENLFVPGREGRSRAGAASVEYRLRRGTRLLLNGSAESGDNWSTHRVSAILSHSLIHNRMR
jgi:hypothetical protein